MNISHKMKCVYLSNYNVNSSTKQKIAHLITAVDCQPMFDGGILINVLGQLKVNLYALERVNFQ